MASEGTDATRGPGAGGGTRRQRIVTLLRGAGDWTFEELRRELGVPTHVLREDLAHVEKSARHLGASLHVEPGVCRGCGFVLTKRRRFTAPGRCPRCRSERLEPPRFHLG